MQVGVHETFSHAIISVTVGFIVTIGSMFVMYIFNQLLKIEPLCYYNPLIKYINYKKILHTNITFNDIVGCDEIKEDLRNIAQKIGDKSNKIRSKGFIFYGPPGTGKTLMAKAVANEINFPIFSIADKYVFNGSCVVQTIKGIIYRNTPCVIIMDEGFEFLKNATHDFLELLDGLENTKNVIFIITLTKDEFSNIPVSITRSGRIDRIIKFNYPNNNEIKTLLQINTQLNTSDIEMICDQLPQNITHSDIVSLKERIDIDKPKDMYDYITKNITKIIGLGKETNTIIHNKADEDRISYHEIGHFMTGLMIKTAQKPNNISIMSHGEFAGCTSLNRPNIMFTLEELLSMSCVFLSGGFFEKHYTGSFSTGIMHDITRLDSIVDVIIKSKLITLELICLNNSNVNIETEYPNRIKTFIIDYVQIFINRIIVENDFVIQKFKNELCKKKNLTIKDVNLILEKDTTDKYTISVQNFLETIVNTMSNEQKNNLCKYHNLYSYSISHANQPMSILKKKNIKYSV
jgi:cell division protease FtsH